MSKTIIFRAVAILALGTSLGGASASLSAQEPSSFPPPYNTQDAPQGITTPEAALAALRLPPGFQATLFAAEPAVRQPIALATDHRGRLWVAECYTYAEQKTNFDLRLHDRILVFEDTNDDGTFDKRTVFWDQASRLTSIEVGFGGVWALCAPYLLFIPDRNGDDVPDGAPEIVLDGWNGDEIRHNIVNGLRWGPDGWLYGRHGITTSSHVGAAGASPDQRTTLNCSIWRIHPNRRVFEVVCHGTTNSWGMDWDEHGQMFFINTVIGHLWHVVPGAHYQRMYGEDFNPYLYELLPQTADHFHWDTVQTWSESRNKVTPTTDRVGGGHAHCGMMIYQGGVWPAHYHNTVFTVNLHGRRLNNDRLARRGADYVGTHEPDFLATTDPWFRGVEVTASPGGDMYLADWSDIGECHENDGVHRSTGRIFKISFRPNGGGSAANQDRSPDPTQLGDLATATNAMLVAAQFRRNEWVVRQARRLLQERAAAGQDMSRVHEELHRQFDQDPLDTHQLRALWALYVTGGANEKWLLAQLSHASEHVRAWAVQLLCDSGSPTEAARTEFVALARREKSGLVLQFLTSALQRMPVDQRLALAEPIAAHAEFGSDPVLPLMLWYGIEPAVPLVAERATQLARSTEFKKTRQFIARRLTVEIERQPEAVARLVEALRDSRNPSEQLDYLQGMADALRGWRKVVPPPSWNDASARLVASGNTELASLSRELSIVFGDGRAVDELRKIAATPQSDLESRRAALRALTAAKASGVVELLRKLIGDRDLQRDAIRGLAAYNDPETPRFLVNQFRRLHVMAQPEAINTLVSRPEYARVLIEAVAAGQLDRQLVTPFHLRQIQTFGDDSLNQSIAKLWPELKQLASEKSQRIAELRQQLTAERLAGANRENGKALFQRACANCHVLFGQGGKIGPDLTGAQRTNLNYLLENIVDPSATVTENFRMSIVLTTDGRVINGIVGEKTSKTLTVVTPTERIVLGNDEIDAIRPANLSIMPEGQLEVLNADQVRDLIGYLMAG